MLKVAIIADDLTGLNAVAVEFKRMGHRVRVCMNNDDLELAAKDCDVLGIDTNSRAIDPDIAHKTVYCATRSFIPLCPSIVMKQTDSSLHGNIASELRAVLEASSEECLVFAPACPSQGRFTRQGAYIERDVHGFQKRDIKTLFASDNDLTLQAVPTRSCIPKPVVGRHITICDADTDSDMDHIVSNALSSGHTLFGGSVGLAKALGRHLWIRETNRHPPVLLIIGSLQKPTQIQRDILNKMENTELFNLTENSTVDLSGSIIRSLQSGKHAIISVSAGSWGLLQTNEYPYLDRSTRKKIDAALRQVAGNVLNTCCNVISGVLVAGGATSEIVARDVLGIHRFENFEYLDDGVAAGMAMYDSNKLMPFVTKAGTWGSDDVLLRAVLWMQKAYCKAIKMDKN